MLMSTLASEALEATVFEIKWRITVLWLIQSPLLPLKRPERDKDIQVNLNFGNSTTSPVSNSSRPLNGSAEGSFKQGQPRPKVNIFTNSSEKKTCVQLCLLFWTQIQAPSRRYLRIFYFRSRLTLYEWVFSVSFQWPRRIRNWTFIPGSKRWSM